MDTKSERREAGRGVCLQALAQNNSDVLPTMLNIPLGGSLIVRTCLLSGPYIATSVSLEGPVAQHGIVVLITARSTSHFTVETHNILFTPAQYGKTPVCWAFLSLKWSRLKSCMVNVSTNQKGQL